MITTVIREKRPPVAVRNFVSLLKFRVIGYPYMSDFLNNFLIVLNIFEKNIFVIVTTCNFVKQRLTPYPNIN